MPTTSLRKTWPKWTNDRIVLFHGTVDSSADSIVNQGVNLSRCGTNSDFGVGFYTTTYKNQAGIFSTIKRDSDGGKSKIVRLTLDRLSLGALRNISFLRASRDAMDYWSFVCNGRLSMPHLPASGGQYDVAYGPVAKAWKNPNYAEVWDGYDQISFHTADAVRMLNDKKICSLEIV